MVLIPNGDIYSTALKIKRAGDDYPMTISFVIGYGSDTEEAKRLTTDALMSIDAIVKEPKPRVGVAELNSDGIKMNANFKVNMREFGIGDTFDKAVSQILKVLPEAGFEFYPSTQIISIDANGRDDRPRHNGKRPEDESSSVN
jgi:small-conductance mechanosensitive channel